MEVPWETVRPLRNGVVEAVAFAAFCAVCLNPAYYQLDYGILETIYLFILGEGFNLSLNIRNTRSD